MNIKIVQFGEGQKSTFLVIDKDTEKPLFEVKPRNIDGIPFNTLADIFKRILAQYKSELHPKPGRCGVFAWVFPLSNRTDSNEGLLK